MACKFYNDGLNILDKLIGKEREKFVEMLDSLEVGLGETIVEDIYGKYYGNERLDLKTRELITISLLLINGDKEQLGFHIKCAKNLGISDDEIKEAILHSSTVIGLPKALTGLKTFKELQQKDIDRIK